MEPIVFLILSISIIGIVVLLGLSQFKVDSHTTKHFDGESTNFSSFMTKIRGTLLKIRR